MLLFFFTSMFSFLFEGNFIVWALSNLSYAVLSIVQSKIASFGNELNLSFSDPKRTDFKNNVEKVLITSIFPYCFSTLPILQSYLICCLLYLIWLEIVCDMFNICYEMECNQPIMQFNSPFFTQTTFRQMCHRYLKSNRFLL